MNRSSFLCLKCDLIKNFFVKNSIKNKKALIKIEKLETVNLERQTIVVNKREIKKIIFIKKM
jgi:hypothetical protein